MTDEEEILEKMREDAKENGYHLCPDEALLKTLIAGLSQNKARYGYASCPCRISSGMKNYDIDIICPCEYRDADINEFGMCYCGLFVSDEVKNEPSKLQPIPERRPKEAMEMAMDAKDIADRGKEPEPSTDEKKPEKPEMQESKGKEYTIWRCEVCGYLCAREHPPPVCPICKAKSDRFGLIELQTSLVPKPP
jgi:ferredoxin-thioredoxin reductase catalytic subunit